MYKQHKYVYTPGDLNIKIWRYMDFTKFISMISRKTLFFVRTDFLEDPFEGSYTLKTIEQRPEWIKNNYNYKPEKYKKFYFVNCWHMNDEESAAMWKIYTHNNEGIAIQSTIKRLIDCFSETAMDIYIGKIEYIDYKKDSFKDLNTLHPFLFKRKSFEHEKEIRAIIHDPKPEIIIDNGVHIPVILEKLIDNIYLSPNSLKWFRDLVETMLIKYNITKKIILSDLESDPVF